MEEDEEENEKILVKWSILIVSDNELLGK